ncbi:hypothetical protein AB0C02_13100 [Micromonospora sp. NPDC048999]|uniref:hypothetical protein n=1 Tax=Micromonospora sp. NPDC048999 TaxID=3155391 RepID=UPI0033FA64F4
MAVNGGGYQEWAAFLERWRAGEENTSHWLPALAEQDYPADSWARLVARITQALSYRLQSWADALLRAMAAARDEFEVARALTQARCGLASIRAVAGHPGLPAELSRHLRDAVDEQIRSVQQALEDGIESARRAGVDGRVTQARLRTLRDNPITVTGAGRAARADGWAAEPTRPTRRRIIIGPDTPGEE